MGRRRNLRPVSSEKFQSLGENRTDSPPSSSTDTLTTDLQEAPRREWSKINYYYTSHTGAEVTWIFTWMSTEHMFTNAWTFTPTLAQSFPILVSDNLSAQYRVAFSFETSNTASLLTRRRNCGVCENNLKSSSVGSSDKDTSRFCMSHRNSGDTGAIFLSLLNKVG